MAFPLELLFALREAGELSSNDVAARLRDTIADHFRGGTTWGQYITYFGDSESGDVIFMADGDTRKASYEMSDAGDKSATCSIDFEHTLNVVPRTVYEEEADEADTYAAMHEAYRKKKLYTDLPVYERFISKKERDSMDSGDFAGKGRSFPIKTQADVSAAFHSLGRAGADNYSVSTIRANIIRIAKRKGFSLPKSAEKSTKESAAPVTGTLKLSESVAFESDIQLQEAFAPTKEIKLIAPGKGSSAFYPAEVLKRDGPKVFKAGTPMRIDHPTRAEEASRPEGSVKDWGAVLESDAVWRDDHKQGPGLYGRIKPFSDYAQMIEEKGPYAGVSIRANGNAVMEAGKPKMREGVPVLAELTSAEGVDMVTRAGAGGMFLQESARAAEEVQDVTAEEIQKLVESAVSNAVNPYRERALRGDATVLANRILSGVSFTESQKQFVIEESLRNALPIDGDKLDEKKFSDLVVAEAKRFGAAIGTGGKVRGLGAAVEVTEAMKNCPTCDGDGEDEDGEDCSDCGGSGKVPRGGKKAKESAKRETVENDELATRLRESLGMSEAGAKRAAGGR